jgi:mutator protein MutT
MIHVTAGIIIREGKLLIAQRTGNQSRPFCWELPGGKRNEKESLKECLKRELFEEFGTIGMIGDLFMTHRHSYPDLELVLHAFFVTNLEGNIQLLAHQNIAWINVSEYSAYTFAEADIPIMKKLVERNNKLKLE